MKGHRGERRSYRAGSVQPASDLARAVSAGTRTAIAAALNLAETRGAANEDKLFNVLDALPRHKIAEEGHLIGITGPPGVGKSSLIARLLTAWRAQGLKVAVVAVDPSSSLSGGALLGDRVRMARPAPDPGVFIRSIAGRGDLGGVNRAVFAMSRLLLAAFDIVVLETIGVGQSESDVSTLTDTTVLLVQPGSGDTVQFLKAGILEIPAIIIVNKADLGDLARRTCADLSATLPSGHSGIWVPQVEAVSSLTGMGIDRTVQALVAHRAGLIESNATLGAIRRRQGEAWLKKCILTDYGIRGLEERGGLKAIENAALAGGDRGYSWMRAFLRSPCPG